MSVSVAIVFTLAVTVAAGCGSAAPNNAVVYINDVLSLTINTNGDLTE